jgi:NAD(P)-dependent dehydrogenase (short-subunit alcohol dehydrogenase family)
VSEILVVRPERAGCDPGTVTRVLTDSFVAAREALEAERPVVVVVAAGDLEGQGNPLDAAVATGLLGMVRTLAIEGAKPGWRINVVAGPGAAGADAVESTIAMLAGSELTGQLLQVGGANLGKLPA